MAARPLAASLIVAAAFAVAGCKPQSHDLEAGLYRAVVELPGGEVPFGLDVVNEKTGLAMYLVNGKERVRVAATVDAQGHLAADLPGQGNRLEAKVTGDEIEGKVTLSRGGAVLEFSAVRGREWRFVEQPLTDNADFAGRWGVTFTDDKGARTHGVAELSQSFHTVTGTMRTAAYELRSLAGDARDEELQLSLFDGTQAVLCDGKLNERGELAGECWSTATGHALYTAVRNPDATLEQ